MDLRPGKFILFFGIFSLVISLVLIYVMFFVLKEKGNGELLSVILMFIGFFSIGLYLTLHYYKYRVIINDKSLIINNEFGSKKEIHWNQIQKVNYNKTFNMIIIYADKKKTWISPIYSNLIDFIPSDKYSENLKKLIK